MHLRSCTTIDIARDKLYTELRPIVNLESYKAVSNDFNKLQKPFQSCWPTLKPSGLLKSDSFVMVKVLRWFLTHASNNNTTLVVDYCKYIFGCQSTTYKYGRSTWPLTCGWIRTLLYYAGWWQLEDHSLALPLVTTLPHLEMGERCGLVITKVLSPPCGGTQCCWILTVSYMGMICIITG